MSSDNDVVTLKHSEITVDAGCYKLENSVAVIVTYFPDETFKQYLPNLINQVSKVVIVDNSDDKHSKIILDEITNEFGQDVEIILNKTNLGLAQAQNIGVNFAIKHGFDWVLLLDDDSVPDEAMVMELHKFYESYPNKAEIGIVAANIIESNVEHEQTYTVDASKFWCKLVKFNSSVDYLKVVFAISSGSLIRTDIFKKYGLLRAEFFIDYVDIEYCLRLKARGLNSFVVRKAILHHKLGAKSKAKLLNVVTNNHSSFRLFHIYRNSMILCKEYMNIFPGFVAFTLLASCYRMLRIVLMEDDKLDKVTSMLKGAYQGLFQGKGQDRVTS